MRNVETEAEVQSKLRLSSFAKQLGDVERKPQSIENYEAICAAQGLTLSLSAMGCGSFWQMTQPLEVYVARCIADTLAQSEVGPERVDGIVFSTMDQNLRYVDTSFTRRVLEDLGLSRCMPTIISLQQCVSSLAALDYACRLFQEPYVNHVIIVAFDFVVDEVDRIKSFALFGDAVTTCLVSRDGSGLSVLSYASNVDFAGLLGRDTFESRQQMAVSTLGATLDRAGCGIDEIERVFSSNVYKPISLFNAHACGIPRDRVYIDTLRSMGHCGNCDWMLNLMHYRERGEIPAGKKYLAQSSAPAFFACAALGAE